MGSISSEVERYIASRVPIDITLPANKLEAAAEKPHCGKAPKTAPQKAPNRPARAIVPFVFSPILCSIYSMAIYVISKNGKSFPESINASAIISIISGIQTSLQLQLICKCADSIIPHICHLSTPVITVPQKFIFGFAPANHKSASFTNTPFSRSIPNRFVNHSHLHRNK